MNNMMAYCGLICSNCPAYIATQANDREGLEKAAANWNTEPDALICDGCKVAGQGRLAAFCSECQIRACAIARGYETCAPCADYETCEKLAGFHKYAPEARAALDQLRAGA
ncbi:MAG: DUF3795 domain-containing protein [Anaerolineae bacterium]|nr:DUF3795 domain-containing protein [Anaerolineae bacterium]